jgi:CRP/FNR family transcriptional regulator
LINISDFDIKNKPLLSRHPKILEYAKIKHYEKGAIVCQEGVENLYSTIVLQGTLMAYRLTANGQKRLLKFYQPDDLFGVINLCSNWPTYHMTIETLEPVVNLEIPRVNLEKLMLEEPELLLFLFRNLAHKLRYRTEMMDDTFLTAEQTVVRYLVFFTQQFGYKTKHGIVLNMNLTQEYLADYSGVSRATVTRMLHYLTKKNIIRTKPKPWTILQLDQLIHYLSDNQPINTII